MSSPVTTLPRRPLDSGVQDRRIVSRDEAKSLQIAIQCKLKRTEISAEQNKFSATFRANLALQNQGPKTEMYLKGRKNVPKEAKIVFEGQCHSLK